MDDETEDTSEEWSLFSLLTDEETNYIIDHNGELPEDLTLEVLRSRIRH